ncbi:putative patatin/cPLA2 family phospholipase [Bradyrhizobium sp. USDA 4503]
MSLKEPQTRAGQVRDTVLVDLALEGSGSYRAFTWGVLDRLMDEPWLRSEAISGT